MAASQTFTRRGFLALTVAGGAVVTSTVAARASGVNWTALDKALTGALIRPGDAAYPVAARPYNAALGVRHPAAIAQVANRADVSTCLRRVAGHGIPLAARSGGHSYAGFSTPDDGVVVDVSALKKITVKDDGTAVIGAGARLMDVYSALAAHGRALPAGSCPTVGIAGSTLGGGIGVLARAYGLSCDHLTAATVVTADGDVHTASSKHNSDLFWALRGGGGGNSAVVTDLTFATVPAPTVTIFSLAFPAAKTAAVLRAWSAWMSTAPHRLSSLCHVSAAATPTNHLSGTWTGSTTGLSTHLAALIAEVGTAPTTRTTHTYSYLAAMEHFAGSGTPGRETFRAASRMLDHTLTATSAGQIVELMSKQKGMVLLFDSLGGQVGELSSTETAFVHRSAHASVQIYSGSASSAPAVDATQQALTTLVGSGSYVNYLNPDQKDWAAAYYGSNRARLRKVTRKYDPAGVFTFAQSALRA